MAFGSFKSVQEVSKKYQIAIHAVPYLQILPFTIKPQFERDLKFDLEHTVATISEAAACDFLIAPVLKEIWRIYSDSLLIWSHVNIEVDADLTGVPDYLFTRRTPMGLVLEKPYLIVVEAKKQDFELGWAQALAAMVAGQRLNGTDQTVLQGIVSTGTTWEFGKLDGKQFVRDPRTFSISELGSLFGALRFVFEQAKQQGMPTLGAA
jgi:hypothetical protein